MEQRKREHMHSACVHSSKTFPENKECKGPHSKVNSNILVFDGIRFTHDSSRAGKKLCVNKSTIANHLKQIAKSKKLEKWAPDELKKNQRNQRYEVCSLLIFRDKNDLFFERIVTCG